MFCMHCGKSLPPHQVNFCPGCGKPPYDNQFELNVAQNRPDSNQAFALQNFSVQNAKVTPNTTISANPTLLVHSP